MLKEEKGENFIRIISQFIEPLNIVSILNDSRTKANKGGKVIKIWFKDMQDINY